MKYSTRPGGDDKNTWEMSDRNNNKNSVGAADNADGFQQNQSPQPQDYNYNNNNNNSEYPTGYSTGNPLSGDANNTNYAGVAGDVDDTYNNNNNDDENQQQDYSHSSPPPPVPNHQSEYNNENNNSYNNEYPSGTDEQQQQQQQDEPQQEEQQQEHEQNDSHHHSTSSLPRSNRGSTLAPRPEYSPENLGPLKGEADLAPVPPPPSSFRG